MTWQYSQSTGEFKHNGMDIAQADVFHIHGDNSKKPPFSSSEGCIIINGASLRREIATSSDTVLRVVP